MKKRKVRKPPKKARGKEKAAEIGIYINFPSIIHGIAQLTYEIPLVKLQQAIISTMCKMNKRKEYHSFSVADRPGTYDGELSFEIGVANGLYFNYLDDDEEEKLHAFLSSEKSFSVLDFFVIVSYHYFREGKRFPLKFDYHFLRLLFYDGQFEIQLFHNKGIRRMPLDKLIEYVVTNSNNELRNLRLKPLYLRHLRTL